jgi:hypothetical protein
MHFFIFINFMFSPTERTNGERERAAKEIAESNERLHEEMSCVFGDCTITFTSPYRFAYKEGS